MAKSLLDPGLLRSVMRLDPGEPESDLQTNLNALRTEVQPLGIDAHILDFLGRNVDRSHKVPDFGDVFTHYVHLTQVTQDGHGLAGQTRLTEVRLSAPAFLNAATFRMQLDRYKEEVQGDLLGEILQQAGAVLSQGWTPPALKGKPSVQLKGPSDAIKFIESGISALQSRFYSGEIEGSFRLDASAVFDQYSQRKADGFKPGVLSGFQDIDVKHDGLMPGDLAFVLGFTGQYKSTFCLNWAYHAAVYFKKNVAIIPLEMTAKTLLGMLAVIHCHHRTWQENYGFVEVHYDRFRRGQLRPPEEELLKVALHDLQTNKAYGQIIYKEPRGLTTVHDIFRWADLQDRKETLDLLVIDYMGQVNPSAGGNSLKESAHLNAAIAETKQRAMTFRNGRGIAVLSPFQASREGFKEAEKAGGEYSLRALSWANEAERSADFVYSVYMDTEGRAQKRLKWGNLKARDRELISGLGSVFCNPETRVIDHLDTTRFTMHPMPAVAQQMAKDAAAATTPDPATVAAAQAAGVAV